MRWGGDGGGRCEREKWDGRDEGCEVGEGNGDGDGGGNRVMRARSVLTKMW